MTPDEFNELPLMLTAEEVSRLLRIGRTSVYEAIRCGAIPSVKIGRTVRVPRHRLLEMLDQGTSEAVTHGAFVGDDPTGAHGS